MESESRTELRSLAQAGAFAVAGVPLLLIGITVRDGEGGGADMLGGLLSLVGGAALFCAVVIAVVALWRLSQSPAS